MASHGRPLRKSLGTINCKSDDSSHVTIHFANQYLDILSDAVLVIHAILHVRKETSTLELLIQKHMELFPMLRVGQEARLVQTIHGVLWFDRLESSTPVRLGLRFGGEWKRVK